MMSIYSCDQEISLTPKINTPKLEFKKAFDSEKNK